MLFDNTAPSTTFWTPPRRATGFDKTKLALFGYNADGTQNTWGKISSWIPGANVMANRSAEKIASQAGLTEVDNTINSDLDNRLTKLQTLLSAGKVVGGIATANPTLIASGVQGVTQDVAALTQAQDQRPTVQGTTSYRRFAGGGKLYAADDTTEDVVMLDKQTGKKVGEMRYGERIFDQQATIQIEELAGKGDVAGLGKFLMAELATHPDRYGATTQLFAGGGKLLPGGAKSLLEATKNRALPTTNQINQAASNLFDPSSEDGNSMDWLGMGSDVLRGITAAIGAAQPLPTRPVNPNLLQIQRELADRQNEGLSAADRVNLLRQKAATQAADIQAIQSSVGGGGSASAVLAAINKADQNANAFGQQIEAADRSQRAANKDAYYRDLQISQQGSDALYAQQYNTALNDRNAFTQALMANLQNMADRNQYNQAYGKDSPYYSLMTQLMKRTGKNFQYADAPVTSLTPPAL